MIGLLANGCSSSGKIIGMNLRRRDGLRSRGPICAQSPLRNQKAWEFITDMYQPGIWAMLCPEPNGLGCTFKLEKQKAG